MEREHKVFDKRFGVMIMHVRVLFPCILLLIGLPTCHPTPSGSPTPPPAPIFARAPQGIGTGFLGVPLDAHFRPLQGPDARTLFPNPRIERFPLNQMAHESLVVSDTMTLEANLSAWNLADVTGGVASERRYATYRAFQIDFVDALDDRADMETAPADAYFYPWKIFYGHAYEAVVSGNSHGFHAGIAAEFREAGVGVGVEAFARSHNLDVKAFGLGLVPRGPQAIFAQTPEEISRAYAAAGPPVPIFIEYRMLPHVALPAHGDIGWTPPTGVEVAYDQIDVVEDGTWGTTPWDAHAFCTVNGHEEPLLDDHALPTGTRVEDGQSYPMGWHAHLLVAQGDRVECGLRGAFNDTMKNGQIAVGRMKEPVTIQGPGVASGVFAGANADTNYTVRYRIVVH